MTKMISYPTKTDAPHAVIFFIPTILMMVTTMSDLRINFSYDCPPIPDRRWDYSATVDGYEPGDPVGHGATKDEAKFDLLEQLRVSSTAPQPSVQEPIATLHDDGHFTFKPGREPHESRLAGWRMDVYAAPSARQEGE
jgi:hypothetical protein